MAPGLQIQEAADLLIPATLRGEKRATQDPTTGENILVDDLAYQTMAYENPEWFKQRTTGRLSDQDTVLSKNSMGTESPFQLAADKRLRKLYQRSTETALDMFGLELTPIEKFAFTEATVSDSLWDREMMDLDNGTWFLGGSQNVKIADDVPNTEAFAHNMGFYDSALSGLIGGQEQLLAVGALEYGEDSPMVSKAREGDEEALSNLREQLGKTYYSIHEGREETFNRAVQYSSTHPDLADARRRLDDLGLLEDGGPSATAFMIREVDKVANQSAYDILNPKLSVEDRKNAMAGLTLGARVYGPDFIRNAFTGVQESGFDMDQAFLELSDDRKQMLDHLQITPQSFRDAGFDPSNRITFIYALDAAIGQQIGQQERDRELLDDYGLIGSYAIGGAQTLWRGIMDDPQATSEIIPQILTGFGGGVGLARLGMGKGAIYGAGLVQGAAEGFMFGGFASHIDQGSMLAEGTISEVSTGQIVQDALVIGGLSAGLQVGLSGLGIATSKSYGAAADGVAMASTAVARTGAVGGEAKKNALAHDAARLLSNDDISFMRGHRYLTERDQILLQAGEAEAMDVVRRGVETKVTGTDSVSGVSDLLSPSTLDKAGVSQIEAANFVAGVLRDLGDDETISADSLTDIWASYLKERKARGIDGSGTREGRLADDMQFTAREDAANRVVSDAVIMPAKPSRIAAAKATIAKFVGGETANDVKPKELQAVVDVAVRATDLRDLDFYRQFIDTSKVRQFMGDEQADAVIARLDTIRQTTEATREANPRWIKAVELETALDRAVADGGIRVKEELGITSIELRKVVRAYARTAGNKIARQKLEASFGKARLESIIDRAHNDLDDVFRRIGQSSFSFSEFKESAGYNGMRERVAARKKFTSAVNKALRLSNAQDKDAALARAQKSFKKKMARINKDNPNLDIDGASAEALYKTQLDMTKDFNNMSDLERAQRLADGFTRLIDRVDPEAASNAPIAKDVKQMNLLFGGTSVGGKIVAAMSSMALWPLPQSKLFRSRVRVVRGLANLIGNQHVGTRRYGQADVGTIEGAVNAARREIVPIKSQLRGLRIKLGDRGFREFQTVFQTLRMTGKMMDLRDGRLTALPDALMKAYKNDLSAAVKDLTDLDVRYTQYFRQTLEEARNNGSMRQDPENPNLAIDPARYMPHNLNSTLTPDKQTELEDSINRFAREQLKDRASAINEDVMVSLGWIKPATARTTAEGMQVRFEVPEDSIWYGVAGGGQADVDYVLKNAKRGRVWLEEVKAARAAEQASKTRKNIGMARANPGTEAMPRPTSAARQTIANREADRVFGTDPGLKKLEKRADALRSLNIRNMSPDEQIEIIEEYGQVITAMAERQEQLALAAGETDVPPIEAELRRNMTAEDIAAAASDDSTFASMSRGHAALLTRLNNMVIDGTISEESKRLVMLTYADMDLSRFVGLSMYRDSKLDTILVNYENLGRELGVDEGRARFRDDEMSRNVVLTETDDAGGLFHNRTESGRGGTVSINPISRQYGDDYTASTIVHELTHVVFANADPALQATLQVMYNRFFREGMDGPMAKWMRKMGMSESQIRYAGNNVHEFASVMSEITLMKKRIKGNKSAQNFLQKLRLTFQQILDKFLIKDNPRLDKAAKTLGISDRVTELRQSIDALYGRNSEQRAVAMPDLEDVEVDTWQNRVLRNESINRQEDQMLAILKEQEASFLGRPLDDAEERGLIELRGKIADLEESTARREWKDTTGEMSYEGSERLRELLILTKGRILDSTLQNFIRNDGVIVRTTGGMAGTVNDDLESIAKNARIQWKKDQAKAGGSDRTVRIGKTDDGTTMDFDSNPAVAQRADDVENDINTAEGVDNLNVRIFEMMDTADEALAKDIDKVSNMLEVVKFAHEQGMPISSHPVKGLKAELSDAEKMTRKIVEREVDGQIQEVVEEVKLGVDAQRAMVNARSLRTFNWSQMSKEQQEALVDFAAQFGITKTQLKSSGPVLGKIKGILEAEKTVDEAAPAEVTSLSRGAELEPLEVTPEPEMTLDPVEIAADNNALVQSTTAARSAGQDGQIAPEHPVTVEEIVEIAKDAETPAGVEAKLDEIVEDDRNAELAEAAHAITSPELQGPMPMTREQEDAIVEKMVAEQEALNKRKTEASGGGDEPPKDPPATAKGPDEDPKPGKRDAAELTPDEEKRKALIEFRKKVGGSALDRILKRGTVQPPLIPGKLNANSRHFGDDLTSAYDNAIDGIGVEEDGVAKRTRQYVNTNAMNMAEARANAADGRDVDILVGRSGERIDSTMQRRFSDADLETEDGQNIARVFAENMDLAENLDGYSRGIGSKVKIQTALNQIFGVKGMTMADLFKEGTDAIHAVLETDVNSGRRTMRKTEAERKYADEAMKQLKMMYLHTIGVPVTQFDRKSGLGRAMQIATNLVYSKLGGTFSQAVALVEAPFSILRTGGMGPTQILKNATQMLGGITQMAAGVAQRNTGPAGRMAAQFGLDAERMGYLSDDLVTYLDNFDGGGGLARFGMNDQDGGHMSAATIGDRVKANFRRVAQAGQDEGEDASWLASRIEAGTAALADMTGALSGMEQVTGIARSVGAGVGRESLVKHGDKLRQLAQQIDGKDVSDKELISMARSLGIPRAIASRAGSSGLLRNGGHALNILEEMLNIRYGKRGSRGNAINLTALSDSVAERHQLQRSQFLGTSAEERAAQQLDNEAIGQVQDYLMTFVKTASPELKGSLALGRGNPLAQFMFSMTSYPMAAFQHLVSNGAKFNGVAATAGTLSLLMAFEFNHRMIRTITSSRDEDRRNEALETLQKAYTGKLSMDEYATVLATYGSQSPLFGHWGKWAGEAAALAGPFAGFDVEQGFPNKPFASPVVGTFSGTVGKMTGLVREAGKEALGESPRTRRDLETRRNRLAKGMAELIDVGTPFNSGAIQVLSQAATGNKLGDAIGTALFMGDRGFQTNGTGATPPAMLEGRSNRLWNQTVQHDQTAQAPDYKEFARDILSPSPAPPSGETVPEAKPPVISPSSPPPNASAGLADSLSKRK